MLCALQPKQTRPQNPAINVAREEMRYVCNGDPILYRRIRKRLRAFIHTTSYGRFDESSCQVYRANGFRTINDPRKRRVLPQWRILEFCVSASDQIEKRLYYTSRVHVSEKSGYCYALLCFDIDFKHQTSQSDASIVAEKMKSLLGENHLYCEPSTR